MAEARQSDRWLKPQTIETGDIQLGAVEIKDGTADTRATVGASGLEVNVKAGLATVSIGASRVTVSGADVINDVMKVEERFSYKCITSVSTVAVKASAGFFHSFNVGVPSCPTTIFFDSATGNATILHMIAAGYPQGTHLMDVKFDSGLSIDSVQSGAAAVVPQIMVAWR